MSKMGDKIRDLRIKNNMTQAQLAEILGMKTYTTVSKWESNDNLPKHEYLVKLSDIFDVSLDYLFGLNDHADEDVLLDTNDEELLEIFNALKKKRKKKVLKYAKKQLKKNS